MQNVFKNEWKRWSKTYALHFAVFLEYILHWFSLFIHSCLHFALFLDHRFHSFLTIFCIIFGQHLPSSLNYKLYYIWTTFCIGALFSFIFGPRFALFLDYILHWNKILIHFTLHFPLFLVYFALVFRFHSFLTTYCIIFGPLFSFILDHILYYY